MVFISEGKQLNWSWYYNWSYGKILDKSRCVRREQVAKKCGDHLFSDMDSKVETNCWVWLRLAIRFLVFLGLFTHNIIDSCYGCWVSISLAHWNHSTCSISNWDVPLLTLTKEKISLSQKKINKKHQKTYKIPAKKLMSIYVMFCWHDLCDK